MRIRTVKPSFWKSETLARIDKEHRLLAIALLNYADDEGFFMAHEVLIRGECFPFDEDSKSIRRGLQELSAIGYIVLGSTSDGQRIGHIPNFLEHQRVDKASPSKIKLKTITWEDSPSPPRILQESSHTEVGSRKGSRKGIPRKVAEAFAVPEWIPAQTWDDYLAMRTRIRKHATDRAKVLTVAALAKLRDQGHDPRAVLEQSIQNSWQGVFPLKAGSSTKPAWEGAK